MKLAKSVEFFTKEEEFLTKGDKIETKCYVGEFIKETIGLRGYPGLCILGRSYIEVEVS